jgi:hypothetical protein
VTVEQSGDTLRIGTVKQRSISFGNKRELRAELTLPNLRQLTSGGVGAAEVKALAATACGWHWKVRAPSTSARSTATSTCGSVASAA